ADRAESLYQDAIRIGEGIVAPPLLPMEITNLVRQRMRRPKRPGDALLTLAEAQRHLERFLSFAVTLQLWPQVHVRALELAATYHLPAAYDAHYLALAELFGI